MRDDLLVDFAESGDRSEGDAHEQGLAGGAISLGVFNQLSAVDEDLCKLDFKAGIVNLKLQKGLGDLVFEVGGL